MATRCCSGLNAGSMKPYSSYRITGSARMNAKISVTPIVVVNGSPIPSVTGLSPSGARESPAIALSSAGHGASDARARAAEAPLPGRSSAPTTTCSWVATTRALCWTV